MFERFATLAARLRAAAKPVAAANALSASHLGPARNPTRAPHRPQPTGSDTMDPGPHSRPLRPSARVVPQSDLRTRFSSWSSDCDASLTPPRPSMTQEEPPRELGSSQEKMRRGAHPPRGAEGPLPPCYIAGDIRPSPWRKSASSFCRKRDRPAFARVHCAGTAGSTLPPDGS